MISALPAQNKMNQIMRADGGAEGMEGFASLVAAMVQYQGSSGDDIAVLCR